MTVLIHRPERDRWCELRSAVPGGRIVTRCRDAIDYQPVCIATGAVPADLHCPACGRERSAEIDLADIGGES